jgi:antirestriction protein ArdC
MKKEQLQEMFNEMLNRKLNESWEKPWFVPVNTHSAVTNYKTGQQYKNGNFIFLLFASMFKNFSTLQFMTFKQGLSLGYLVNKGSEGLPVYYYSFSFFKVVNGQRRNLPESSYNTWTTAQLNEAKITKLPFIKIHHVFNVSQFTQVQTGESLQSVINKTLLDETEGKGNVNANPERMLQGCETLLTNWECKINLVPWSDRCFYSPASDFIQLSDRPQFKNNEFFYATLLHEVTHSTGHDIRTGRIKKFNESYKDHSKSYAIEELVAEISSAFIMASNNFAPERQKINSAIYLQGWKESLKEDENLAFKVCAEAYKAISYIAERFPEAVPFFNIKTESHSEVEEVELVS